MESPAIRLSAPDLRISWDISVLYEDEHVMAVCKPTQLLTSPDRYDPNRPNLMKLLHQGIERKAPWAAERNLTYLSNAHRLDFETSGIILLAKNKPALTDLANQFGSEKTGKVYVALVHGTPYEREFRVDKKLAPDDRRPGLMRVAPKQGKKSTTDFEVRELYRGYTLMRCKPLTGRTHQIRVHLSENSLPIAGDSLYGADKKIKNVDSKTIQQDLKNLSRFLLHAAELGFTHPRSGERLFFRKDWPEEDLVKIKSWGLV